jgi:hypothetical protein
MQYVVPIAIPKPKRTPPTIPTDTILPLHPLDNHWVVRNDCLVLGLRFDAVLSPEKLAGALEKLARIGDWRKMGARLRRNKVRCAAMSGLCLTVGTGRQA